MHIATMIGYGLTIWFAMLLFSALSGEHFWTVLLCGPLIVSAAVGFLVGLDWLIMRYLEKPEVVQQEPAE